MESLGSFVGTEVYCKGKIIGRINDFIIDTKHKVIEAISCTSSVGIIRGKFFVSRDGILHLDRNGVVVDKNKVSYKRAYLEEYGFFGIFRENDYFSGSMGDIYFDPITFELQSVTIKKSFLDDILYGREVVDIKDVSMTEKGLVIVNRE